MFTEKMNILFFIVHDSGRYFGCYDRPITASPNIDRFAEEGINFKNAFASSVCCGPSRACIMTGKYAHQHMMLGTTGGWPLPSEVPTLVDHLNEGGYQTAHFGFTHEKPYGEMHYEIDGEHGTEKEHFWDDSAEDVVDHAIEFLTEDRDSDRPFFLHCATGETHMSHYWSRLDMHGGVYPSDEVYIPPQVPELQGAYIDTEISDGVRNKFKRARSGCGDPLNVELTESDIPPAPSIRDWMAHHYASTKYVDIHFQRLLDVLDEKGLSENTLVVFTTDHGITQMRSKGTLYDQGTEVALAMRLPGFLGLKQGYAVNHLTQNMDLFPTFMEAAGLECPPETEAGSLWPLLRGEDRQPNEAIFLERNYHGEPYGTGKERRMVDMWDPTRAVRTNEYLYIRNLRAEVRERRPLRHELKGFRTKPWNQDGIVWEYDPTGPRTSEELYHVTLDPVNQNDVADRPEYAEVKKKLAEMCDKWMKETDDFVLRGEQPSPHREQAVEII